MGIEKTRLYAESWNVAFRYKPQGAILTDKTTPFNIVKNPKRYWIADPMVFEHQGKTYIFAEMYDYLICRGVIGFSELKNGEFRKWKVIIKENFHMSYPFVFEHNGKVYMIPETRDSKKVILYQAIQFPEKWERYKILAENVEWVDTTIGYSSSGFLGFTESLAEPNEDLMIKLDDNFNLISVESIGCVNNKYRCGGKFFSYKNKMIRVNQDCEHDYGKALYFNICDDDLRVISKSIHIKPEELKFDKKILLEGMHTYNATESIEVIDLKTKRFNLINLYKRLF